jgi:hypothetical protein
MNKFKVGDRVAVYDGGHRYEGNILEFSQVIGASSPYDCVVIRRVANGKTMSVHPKQCRRLGKKERRRVWMPQLNVDDMFKYPEYKDYTAILYKEKREGQSLVEFIEVRKKK